MSFRRGNSSNHEYGMPYQIQGKGYKPKTGTYFEYSSNEKVAFETAAGAAYAGVRSLTAMKHFGLNVAADSVGPVAYTGVKAGMVVMVADDPQGWSSAQSEQDMRYFLFF